MLLSEHRGENILGSGVHLPVLLVVLLLLLLLVLTEATAATAKSPGYSGRLLQMLELLREARMDQREAITAAGKCTTAPASGCFLLLPLKLQSESC